MEPPRRRIFLLSPANAGGERARMVLNERARFEPAETLRNSGAPIADLFAFISGLYFRGKIAYARAFAAPPSGLPYGFVIAAGRGLLLPETPLTLDEFREIARIPIDAADARYREPLVRDLRILNESAGPDCDFVLLGSVATGKYAEPLAEVLGERLLFPADFAGRGDMSRGGLMLRCARAGIELPYVPVIGGSRHGSRPPKLPKYKRQ